MPDTLKRDLPANRAAQILAVDDEPYVRDLVCRWLKGAGHVCAQAGNADAAWQHLQGHDVDLMVLDVNMPGRTGVELLDDIQATYPNTAVLMMTANGDTKTVIHALTHGAWGYLVKPVEREELLFQVNAALERRQLRLERRDYTRDLEEKVREQTAEIRNAHEETIHRLVTASLCRDEETGMHIRRTGLLSEALARAAGWSAADAEIDRVDQRSRGGSRKSKQKEQHVYGATPAAPTRDMGTRGQAQSAIGTFHFAVSPPCLPTSTSVIFNAAKASLP